MLLSQKHNILCCNFIDDSSFVYPQKSMFGRRLEAVGEDSKAADSMGLNLQKHNL